MMRLALAGDCGGWVARGDLPPDPTADLTGLAAACCSNIDCRAMAPNPQLVARRKCRLDGWSVRMANLFAEKEAVGSEHGVT